MTQIFALSGAADTHNQAGCPFWNQTLRDAVPDYTAVLAKIDRGSLSPDLLGELQQLQRTYAATEIRD
jgi:hypothetical protein